MKINNALPRGLVYFSETSAILADDWQHAPDVVWETTGAEIDGRTPVVARVFKDALADRMDYRVTVEME